MAIEPPRRKTGLVLKSRREIALMRDACQVVAEAHQLIARLLEPGITTGELDAAVEKLFEQRNAIPLFKGFPGEVPFPAVTCISVNEEVVHGIPGERVLREGDIISVDTGCKVRGWCGDGAWTYPVGEVSEEVRRLLDTGRRTLEIAIQGLATRNKWSEIARMMERHVDRSGFSPVLDFVGHGIGREMHEPPQIPNYGPPGRGPRLKPGMVFAIEPMVTAGGPDVRILDDEWTAVTADGSLAAHFEHTILVTESGPEVLTRVPGSH